MMLLAATLGGSLLDKSPSSSPRDTIERMIPKYRSDCRSVLSLPSAVRDTQDCRVTAAASRLARLLLVSYLRSRHLSSALGVEIRVTAGVPVALAASNQRRRRPCGHTAPRESGPEARSPTRCFDLKNPGAGP
jgi:hypothetical protein